MRVVEGKERNTESYLHHITPPTMRLTNVGGGNASPLVPSNEEQEEEDDKNGATDLLRVATVAYDYHVQYPVQCMSSRILAPTATIAGGTSS